ncbi:hypothetical protein ABW636_02575 [Aquimarina sp. 2201CG1-2-11]|uniref:hypothetical protein n=1 Tax=Aquimarina discodermiae TaxID=3231043 RepID=UPI003462685E
MKTFFINFVFLIFLMNANAQCIDSNVNINYERISYTNGQPCTSKIKSKIKVNNASSYSSMFVRVIDVDDSGIALKQKTFKIKRVASDGSWQYSWTANYSSPTIKRMKIEHYLIKKSNNTRVLVCSKTLYQCENDYDEDGISNHQDHCIYESGPVSNNGCPESKNTNLVVDLDFSAAYSQCTNCTPVLDEFFSNNEKHIVRGGTGNISFNKLEIRNVGKTTSNSSKVKIYFSKDNELTLQGDNKDKLVKEVSIPSRNPNSSFGFKTDINGWSFNNNNGLGTGNYFILIVVDATNTNNEGTSGEADNILRIGIYYEEDSPSSNSHINGPYEVQVFNLSGIFLIKKTVNSKEEENIFLNNMPIPGYGPYIVKNGTETYKFVRGRR